MPGFLHTFVEIWSAWAAARANGKPGLLFASVLQDASCVGRATDLLDLAAQTLEIVDSSLFRSRCQRGEPLLSL